MKPKTTLRIIQLLLVLILCLQVYSWTINTDNTSIAYNKYETFLRIKKRSITASNDVKFLKNEALENIDIIRNNDHKKHKTANVLFVLLPIQGALVILILLLSFRLKFGKTDVISKTATNIHPVLTNID